MKDIVFVKMVEVLNAMPVKNIMVNNDTNAAKMFVTFMECAKNKYGYEFCRELNALGFKKFIVFKDYINSQVFRDMLAKDSNKKLIERIKFSKAAEMNRECENIYNKYKNYMFDEIDDTENNEGVFAIRTKWGNGPVVFVRNMSDFNYEARHEVRRWYAWKYKINYFEVRECSYDFWNNHEESRYATAA